MKSFFVLLLTIVLYGGVCIGQTGPVISFEYSKLHCSEDTGAITLVLTISKKHNLATSVKVSLDTGCTATNGSDFIGSFPQKVTFPANTSTPQYLSIPITDDSNPEGMERIRFVLSEPTNNASIGDSATSELTILDNDGSAAITKVEGIGWRVYPNPADQQVAVMSDEVIHTLQVTNVQGEIVAVLYPQTSSFSVDVSAFSPGLYLFRAYTARKNAVVRLILNR